MIEFFKQNSELLIIISATLAVCLSIAWAVLYHAAYAVRSQVWGETIWSGNTGNNSVALTFDDGPALDTPAILDVLREANVKATFFLIGKQVEKYPDIARRISEEHHEIGSHSFSHPIFLFCGAGRTRRELEKTQEIIKKVTGIAPRLARPPYGVRSRSYFNAAGNLSLRTIQWSDTGFDWKKISAEKIAANVLETVQSDSIILLHDGDSAEKEHRTATVKAIPLIVKGLRDKGLRVAPLTELLAEKKLMQIHYKGEG